MSDTKMLQAILDGQSALKEELKDEFKGEIGKLKNSIEGLSKKIDENGRRIDMLGLQLAELDDDAPTSDEFEELEKRVSKLEVQMPKSN